MKKSILQKDITHCYICGRYASDLHHIRLGNLSRDFVERQGLYVNLCRECHCFIHDSGKISLQQEAQRKLESQMSHEEYMSIYHKNYL